MSPLCHRWAAPEVSRRAHIPARGHLQHFHDLLRLVRVVEHPPRRPQALLPQAPFPTHVADHADERSTFSLCPSASAHLCSVASVGFSIFPVSNRDSAGGSIPIRSATSASVSPWLSRTALNCATRLKIAAKL